MKKENNPQPNYSSKATPSSSMERAWDKSHAFM
jgi:hypothetical protein